MTNCHIRYRGVVQYTDAVAEMEDFTNQRKAETDDEIWVLQHPAIFTQGTSCHTTPNFNPDRIPVVHANRGGQITYHGPGQLIIYMLLDLKRAGIGPKKLVATAESSVISLLNQFNLNGKRREGAPGVYVRQKKIAALGFRIRNGKCFHGLSLNVNMDLTPFTWIDPCGIENLEVTQLVAEGINVSVEQVGEKLVELITNELKV